MLRKINYGLILLIALFAIYAITLHFSIYKNHRTIIQYKEKLDTKKLVQKQLELELLNKNSNNFVDKFAKEELKMFIPKKIRILE